MWKSKLNTTYLSGSARSAITQVNSLQHFSCAIEKKWKVWMQCAHVTKSDLGLLSSTSYLPHGSSQCSNCGDTKHGCTIFNRRQSSLFRSLAVELWQLTRWMEGFCHCHQDKQQRSIAVLSESSVLLKFFEQFFLNSLLHYSTLSFSPQFSSFLFL